MSGRRFGRPIRLPAKWQDWTPEQRSAWWAENWRSKSLELLDDGKGRPDPSRSSGEHVRRLVKVFCVAEDCGAAVGTVEQFELRTLWRDPGGSHWTMPPVHPSAVPSCPEHGRIDLSGLDQAARSAVDHARVVTLRAKPTGSL